MIFIRYLDKQCNTWSRLQVKGFYENLKLERIRQIYNHNLASIRIVEWYHEYMTIVAARAHLNEVEMAELKKSAAGVTEQTKKVNNNY